MATNTPVRAALSSVSPQFVHPKTGEPPAQRLRELPGDDLDDRSRGSGCCSS